MFHPDTSNRAEMMGAPGAGKSWLWAVLSERLAGPLVTPSAAVEAQRAGRREALQDDPRIVAFLDEGRRMMEQGDADRTIRRRRKLWLSRELATVLTAEAAERPVLCNEGLIQRGISAANCHGDGAAIAERYFRMVPPPRAVIVVGTPRALIEARITARGPHQAGHLRELDGTLAHVATGLRILAERGTAIVPVDGARLADGDEAELAGITRALRTAMAGTA